MGSGFQVDVSAMDQLVSTLKNAAQSITDANNALKNSSPEDLGSNDLDSAGGDFQDRWTYGTGKISDLTGQIVDALQDTVKAYQDCDSQIGQQFSQAAENAGSPGSGTVMRGKLIARAKPASHISETLAGANGGH